MPPPPTKHETLIENAGHARDASVDDEKEEYLGNGAKAEWISSGFGVLDANGESDVGNIIIHGADDRDIEVNAKIEAVIGPLDKSLLEMNVLIPKGESIVIPVDLKSALGLHEKQAEYTTRIKANFISENTAGEIERFGQNLDSRYLAVNETSGALEIMDTQTRDQKYPYGFTTRKGQEKIKRLTAISEKEGNFIEAIGPNIDVPEKQL